MWNPPITLTPEEQKIVARLRKMRQFFVFLRERRHALLDAVFQDTLAATYNAELGGKAPWKLACWPSPRCCRLAATSVRGMRSNLPCWTSAGRWCWTASTPRIPLQQRHTVQLSHAAYRAQLGQELAGSGRSAGGDDQGIRRQAAASSSGLYATVWRRPCGGQFNLLGHALRKAVGLAAHALDAPADTMLEGAGLVLVGHSSLNAALDLDWGTPQARAKAPRLILEEVDRW